MKVRFALSLPLLLLALSWVSVASSTSPIQEPVLKWQYAGCTSWCMTGWYASPAVADLDGDGTQEVIWASYKVFVVDGQTGDEVWSVYTGHDRSYTGSSYVGRTWPGVVVADVDNNGDLEIVTAHSGGYVSVYNHDGYFYPNWPRRPSPSSELRSLAVYDLDGDGDLEIIVASTSFGSDEEWYVYEHNGSLRPGWPQLTSGCCAAGCFNENLAAGDLDGDGQGEIVAPSDVHYMCAFEANASIIPAHPMFAGETWCEVGIAVDLVAEERGWVDCGTEHRPNFADSAPIMVDINNDGGQEVAVVGNVYNCEGAYTSLYNMIFLREPDLSRFNEEGFDWTTIPVPEPGAAPLSEDWNVIETCVPNPAAVDLDGDSYLEILYSSYDGRVHAYWLDKTQHHNWPYAVYKPSEGVFRFASEPAVADLDNDGSAEVIFGSWPQKGGNRRGKLHILDMYGNPIHEISVPAPLSGDWNGILGAPTLANVDEDPDLEVVVGTAHSGICAYDLPGTAEARILWGTGRGNYQRSGSVLETFLHGSTKDVDRVVAQGGEDLRYTITLEASGSSAAETVQVTDTLPSELDYVGDLWASAGSYGEAAGVITWTGTVQVGQPVAITFGATVDAGITLPTTIANEAMIVGGAEGTLSRRATTLVNFNATFLPLGLRSYDN